jgi:hypothetical protein
MAKRTTRPAWKTVNFDVARQQERENREFESRFRPPPARTWLYRSSSSWLLISDWASVPRRRLVRVEWQSGSRSAARHARLQFLRISRKFMARKRTKLQREDDLIQVAGMHLKLVPQTEIAKRFGLSQAQISKDIAEIHLRWKPEKRDDLETLKSRALAELRELKKWLWQALERKSPMKRFQRSKSILQKLLRKARTASARPLVAASATRSACAPRSVTATRPSSGRSSPALIGNASCSAWTHHRRCKSKPPNPSNSSW